MSDQPVLWLRIREGGPNGTEKELENVVTFKQTADGLRVTFLGGIDQTFGAAQILAGGRDE